jgi:hypothetical protein
MSSSQASTRSSHHGAGAACSPKSFGHHDVWMRPSPVDVLQETLAASACAAAASATTQEAAAHQAQQQPGAGAARCAASQHSKSNSATSSLMSFDGSVASCSTAGLPISLNAASHGLDALLFSLSGSPQKSARSGLGLALHEHQQRPAHLQHSHLGTLAAVDASDARTAGPLGTSPVAFAARACGAGSLGGEGCKISEAGAACSAAGAQPGEGSTVSAAGEVARLRSDNAALQRRLRKVGLLPGREASAESSLQ